MAIKIGIVCVMRTVFRGITEKKLMVFSLNLSGQTSI